jgi:hypothetical protein
MSEFRQNSSAIDVIIKRWALLFLALSVNRTCLLHRDCQAVIQKNNLKRSDYEIQPHPER